MKVTNAIKKEIARVDFTQSVYAYLYPLSKKKNTLSVSVVQINAFRRFKKITLTPRASLDILNMFHGLLGFIHLMLSHSHIVRRALCPWASSFVLLLLVLYQTMHLPRTVVWQTRDLHLSRNTLYLLSPRLFFFIVLKRDLFVYRDESFTN